jgi:hypothetical protein
MYWRRVFPALRLFGAADSPASVMRDNALRFSTGGAIATLGTRSLRLPQRIIISFVKTVDFNTVEAILQPQAKRQRLLMLQHWHRRPGNPLVLSCDALVPLIDVLNTISKGIVLRGK